MGRLNKRRGATAVKNIYATNHQAPGGVAYNSQERLTKNARITPNLSGADILLLFAFGDFQDF